MTGTAPGRSPNSLAVVGAIVLGIVAGALGGILLGVTERRGWSSRALQPIAAIGLALLVYGLALAWDLNGFVAAFVAGISFGAAWHPKRPGDADLAIGLASDVGGILSAVVWLMFGAMLVPALDGFDWQAAVFAVLALTLVRGAAVAVSLIGVGFDRATVRFLAWFGPRGLASVVFCLIAYDELTPTDARFVLTADGDGRARQRGRPRRQRGPAGRAVRAHAPGIGRGDAGAPAFPSRALGRRRMPV